MAAATGHAQLNTTYSLGTYNITPYDQLDVAMQMAQGGL